MKYFVSLSEKCMPLNDYCYELMDFFVLSNTNLCTAEEFYFLTLGAHAQRGLLWSLGSFFPSVCSTNISPVRRPGVKMKAYILIIRVNLAVKLFVLPPYMSSIATGNPDNCRIMGKRLGCG